MSDIQLWQSTDMVATYIIPYNICTIEKDKSNMELINH